MKNNGCPPLEIYVHIPFCARKCAYCDFLSFPAGEDVQQAYTKALIKEIQALPKDERPVSSVFAGGGTPSLVKEDFNVYLFPGCRDYPGGESGDFNEGEAPAL